QVSAVIISASLIIWSKRDSNSQPLQCHCNALPLSYCPSFSSCIIISRVYHFVKEIPRRSPSGSNQLSGKSVLQLAFLIVPISPSSRTLARRCFLVVPVANGPRRKERSDWLPFVRLHFAQAAV